MIFFAYAGLFTFSRLHSAAVHNALYIIGKTKSYYSALDDFFTFTSFAFASTDPVTPQIPLFLFLYSLRQLQCAGSLRDIILVLVVLACALTANRMLVGVMVLLLGFSVMYGLEQKQVGVTLGKKIFAGCQRFFVGLVPVVVIDGRFADAFIGGDGGVQYGMAFNTADGNIWFQILADTSISTIWFWA